MPTLTAAPSSQIVRGRATAGGFSLLEVLLAASITVIAVFGFMSAMTSSLVLSEITNQSTLATQAARAHVEKIIAEDFTTVYARYNASTTDNPGTGESPGATFVPEGLQQYSGVGTVIWPVNPPTGTLYEVRVRVTWRSPTEKNLTVPARTFVEIPTLLTKRR